jgi:hypothetical protein
MANPSVQFNIHGPTWPLGWIGVPVPGNPVRITSLVDPQNFWAPETYSGPDGRVPPEGVRTEYTLRFSQITFQGFKFGAPTVPNTGNIYVMLAGSRGGDGTKADSGSVVQVIPPGAYGQLPTIALVKNVLNPYWFWLDADNAGDGAFVVGWVF